MGLLNKANENKNSLALDISQTGLNTIDKKKNQIKDFLSEISSLKSGFEYSKELFNSLCKSFDISKGALLLRDSDGNTFSPVTFRNLDITTTRHLRIDSKLLNDNSSIFNKPIHINDKKIRLFKQFLSIREFAALEQLIVIPFYLRGVLHALMLLIDPSKNIISSADELSLNSDFFSNKLIKSNKPFNDVLNHSAEDNNTEPVNALRNYFKQNKLKDLTFLIISINISELQDYLKLQLPDVDNYEISKNILKSINHLISPSGKLVKLSSKKYLLFYTIKKGKTSGIILHQINLAISSFFNISKTLPKIETNVKSFQINEYESADKMLEGII